MIYTYSKLGTHGAAGNQLFQIAGTLGIAASHSADIRLPSWYYSKYFSLPNDIFNPIPEGEHVVDLYPDYLQNINYWYGYDDIPRAFTWSDYAWEQLYKNYSELLNDHSETISVHVRRGNNLNLPNHHPVLPLEYFEEAIDLMEPGLLVVFSDDLDWCKKQDLFRDAYFAKGNDSSVDINELTGANPLFLDSVMLDMALMSQTERHIISNSTFSWWGAFLGYGPQVVYPGKNYNWYGRELSYIDTSVMFPSYWTAI